MGVNLIGLRSLPVPPGASGLRVHPSGSSGCRGSLSGSYGRPVHPFGSSGVGVVLLDPLVARNVDQLLLVRT